jgi:hypothetical protein
VVGEAQDVRAHACVLGLQLRCRACQQGERRGAAQRIGEGRRGSTAVEGCSGVPKLAYADETAQRQRFRFQVGDEVLDASSV